MREARGGNGPWLKVVMGGLLVFLYLPLVVLVALSFNDAQRAVVSWRGFTTRWYGEALSDPALLGALGTTFLIAAVATTISIILGTLLALGLERYAKSSVLDGSVYVPLLVPDVVLGIALLSFFSLIFVPLGVGSIVIAHSVWGTAFAAAIIRTRLRGFDRSIEEASLDLGVKEVPTFFKITLPVILPGIVAAALVVFTLSVDEFVIAYFTAGNTLTFPIQVYSMIRFGVTPEINAIATMLLAFSMVLLVVALYVFGDRAAPVPSASVEPVE